MMKSLVSGYDFGVPGLYFFYPIGCDVEAGPVLFDGLLI